MIPFLLFAVAMAALIVPLATATDSPRIVIDEALADSGVVHPVTAVLLNFRAYDTLLEIAVLLAAALAAFPLIANKCSSKDNEALAVGVVLETFAKLMVPVAALVAAYILWTGTKAPGGAFQSAALLCAIGVLLLVSGWRSPDWTQFRWRVLMAGGLIVFLLVGMLGMLGDKSFLEYPSGWAGGLILGVEFCLTVSLTVILVSLFTSTSASSTYPFSASPADADTEILDDQVAPAINSTDKAQS
jgi:multisubunit Na+/H+ antiporter MnhB subunit